MTTYARPLLTFFNVSSLSAQLILNWLGGNNISEIFAEGKGQGILFCFSTICPRPDIRYSGHTQFTPVYSYPVYSSWICSMVLVSNISFVFSGSVWLGLLGPVRTQFGGTYGLGGISKFDETCGKR